MGGVRESDLELIGRDGKDTKLVAVQSGQGGVERKSEPAGLLFQERKGGVGWCKFVPSFPYPAMGPGGTFWGSKAEQQLNARG